MSKNGAQSYSDFLEVPDSYEYDPAGDAAGTQPLYSYNKKIIEKNHVRIVLLYHGSIVGGLCVKCKNRYAYT
ncbi:hypothetical protein GCM10027291_14070 [Telluribacter humicola]